MALKLLNAHDEGDQDEKGHNFGDRHVSQER